MIITREYLSQYTALDKLIKKIKNRIKYYQEHPVHSVHGVVKGSSKGFPYNESHFCVSGPNVKDDRDRKEKVNQLLIELMQQLEMYEDMKLEIELFISSIADPFTKLMFTYWYIDGMKEEDIAKELHVERSTVHKRIYKYLDNYQLSHNSQNESVKMIV